MLPLLPPATALQVYMGNSGCAAAVVHRVDGHPSVDRVLHLHVHVGLPKRKCCGVAEAFARAPHPDSAWQCSVFECTAILEAEVGFARVRIAVLAGHGLAAESDRPGFEELAGGARCGLALS